MVLTCILIALILILGYTTINLLRKNEKLEDEVENQSKILSGYMSYLNKIADIIEHSDRRLKEVDSKGSFKSDDEVGFFFEQISSIQEILNKFNIKNI
jgi:Tfp pilus assembly protein PilO